MTREPVDDGFGAHDAATLAQAMLVHGLAALALATLVVALADRLAPQRAAAGRRLFVGVGVAAAVASLIQPALEIAQADLSDAWLAPIPPRCIVPATGPIPPGCMSERETRTSA